MYLNRILFITCVGAYYFGQKFEVVKNIQNRIQIYHTTVPHYFVTRRNVSLSRSRTIIYLCFSRVYGCSQRYVIYIPIDKQRPRNKQLYTRRCYVFSGSETVSMRKLDGKPMIPGKECFWHNCYLGRGTTFGLWIKQIYSHK
jgi:hypothetical protein